MHEKPEKHIFNRFIFFHLGKNFSLEILRLPFLKIDYSNSNYIRLFYSKTKQHTNISKISRWCTCIVINVSNLVRSIFVRSLVVWSIKVFKRSRNLLFVSIMIFLSARAWAKASSPSRVQIIWIPNNPIWAGILSRKPSRLKFTSLIILWHCRIMECKESCDVCSNCINHVSTEPSALTALSSYKENYKQIYSWYQRYLSTFSI